MTEPTTTGNIYTYRRISHAEQRSGSASLQWQEQAITQWLNARGRCREYGWIDDGTSASISLEAREGGSRLLKAAVNRGDVILVARMDRLFRDVEDFRSHLRAWTAQGVELVSCTEALDCTTPTGRMIATILASVAEYERELIGQRTRELRETRRAAGLRVTSQPRYGWRYVPFGPPREDGSREHRLEVNVAEQAIIGRIAELWGSCKTYQQIADYLHVDRVPTRKGGRWAASSVADIVRDIRTANESQLRADRTTDNAALADESGPGTEGGRP